MSCGICSNEDRKETQCTGRMADWSAGVLVVMLLIAESFICMIVA